MFKPLTSLKGTNRGSRVTGSSIDSSPLALIVKASTKSLYSPSLDNGRASIS